LPSATGSLLASTEVAAESLNKAERSVAVATERLHNEERKTADAVDAQRQLAAYQRVQSLTAGARNWQDVQGLIDEAERLGDPYLLRALLDVAVPNLREKTHHEVSPFREYGGQIESLARRSRERLRDLEPDSLKQARGEAESAETYFRELRSRVVLLNDHSKLRGGRGVFDSVLHPRKTIQSVNPETGNMVFTTTGRWW
jgi:hypothetical protein